MHTFIKYKDAKRYRLVLHAGDDVSIPMAQKLQSRFVKTTFTESLNKVSKAAGDRANGIISKETEDLIISMEASRTRFIREQAPIDYAEMALKYGSICINENGSWTSYNEENIEREVQSEKWPYGSQKADIVICENDPQAEKAWMEYLKARFPNMIIETVNFFSSRTDEEVLEAFKHAKYITFSTTFSSTDWFLKAVRCMSEQQQIIGFCHDSNMWGRIETSHLPIEIVESLVN